MGIVTDSEFEAERQKTETPSVTIPTKSPLIEGEVVTIPRGRGEGNIETPESVRKLIADTYQSEGRPAAIQLAKSFGLSESSVSAYAVGANSTATYNDRPNASVVERSRNIVQGRALSKLKKAIHHITDDKLRDAKPRELAGIARDMSAVVKAMEPEKQSGEGINTNGGPAFVFYAPKFTKEENYETVYAKE